MKLKMLALVAIIASFAVGMPAVVFSQPNRRQNSYTPGFWQPKTQVNPNLPIEVILLNQSGMPVSFSLVPERDRTLPPGGTVNLRIRNINRTADIANINIYAREELVYDYNANPAANQVFVRIRQAGQLARADKAVYIDEAGRVYSF